MEILIFCSKSLSKTGKKNVDRFLIIFLESEIPDFKKV